MNDSNYWIFDEFLQQKQESRGASWMIQEQFVFVQQILNGTAHLEKHGIVHRALAWCTFCFLESRFFMSSFCMTAPTSGLMSTSTARLATSQYQSQLVSFTCVASSAIDCHFTRQASITLRPGCRPRRLSQTCSM